MANKCSWCGEEIEATHKGLPLVECYRCSELKTLVWNYPELAASMLAAHLTKRAADGGESVPTTGIFSKVLRRVTGYPFPRRRTRKPFGGSPKAKVL